MTKDTQKLIVSFLAWLDEQGIHLARHRDQGVFVKVEEGKQTLAGRFLTCQGNRKGLENVDDQTYRNSLAS